MHNIKNRFTELAVNLVYFGIPVIIMTGFATAVSPLSV